MLLTIGTLYIMYERRSPLVKRVCCSNLELLLLVRIVKTLCVLFDEQKRWAFRPSIPELPLAPGFPSSHTAVIAYFATHLYSISPMLSMMLSLCVYSVAYQRVTSKAHTILQVVAGAIVGIVWAIIVNNE